MTACRISIGALARFRLTVRLCAAALLCSHSAPAWSSTVADFLETRRPMTALEMGGVDGKRDATNVFTSPDGARYVVLLINTDVARDGNWLEVLSGSLGSLKDASQIRTVARLFTRSLGGSEGYGASALTLPGFNMVGWLDNRTIAFLWTENPEDTDAQIMAVNVDTGETRVRTRHPNGIRRFDVGPHGLLIYSAVASALDPTAAAESQARGFSVQSPDAFSLLLGRLKGRSTSAPLMHRYVDDGQGHVRQIMVNGLGMTHIGYQSIPFSHDGRFAVLDWVPRSIPPSWDRYTDPKLRKLLQLQKDSGPEQLNRIWQPHVVALDTGAATPLWDAPLRLGAEIAWSPADDQLLIGKTFLPIASGSVAGLAGRATAVVDLRSGEYEEIIVPEACTVSGVKWPASDLIQIACGQEQVSFNRQGGRWHEAEQTIARVDGRHIVVSIAEDMNKAPELVAFNHRSSERRRILDFNPQLHEMSLGRAEAASWQDKEGRTWHGRLYYPVNYEPGRRYPLVIQTSKPIPSTSFSLFGGGRAGLGASYGAYAAQALVNRGMAVLMLEQARAFEVALTPQEPEMYLRAYESAAEHFVAAALAERQRIGLTGLSRLGWYVEYALAHSEFPFAAAVAVDNFDGGYLQAALSGWEPEIFMLSGATPFGAGLQEWLRRAPPFNVEKIGAALQIQRHQAGLTGLLGGWEMFSRLRYLQKPVELYAIPDIEHGSHGLQNPRQCAASQERAVDWLDFWLNGHEDASPAKRVQYAEWRELRRKHEMASESRITGR